jgi:multidrug efflux system membrane fusion protein
MVDPGNYVTTSQSTSTTSGTTGTTTSPISIVIVNQIEPIAVTFWVPQGDYQRLSKVSDGFRKPLATQALSQETSASLGTGELSIADNRVDPTTGTVEMKARFDNTGDLLLPGQFVNVRLTLQILSNAITIPAAAVNQGPSGLLRVCGRGQPDRIDAADQGRLDRGHDGGNHYRSQAWRDRRYRRTDVFEHGLGG